MFVRNYAIRKEIVMLKISNATYDYVEDIADFVCRCLACKPNCEVSDYFTPAQSADIYTYIERFINEYEDVSQYTINITMLMDGMFDANIIKEYENMLPYSCEFNPLSYDSFNYMLDKLEVSSIYNILFDGEINLNSSVKGCIITINDDSDRTLGYLRFYNHNYMYKFVSRVVVRAGKRKHI